MEPSDIKEGLIYASQLWKGDREVTTIEPVPGQDDIVHFVNLLSGYTGHAPLLQFAKNAEKVLLNNFPDHNQ